MTIYGDLKVSEHRELPDELTLLAAEVLRQYILEDDLSNQGEDETLEILMRIAERFMQRYMDVVSMHLEDPNWIAKWQGVQNNAFTEHAKKYSPLYSGISHLAREPHFVSPWAMCFLVEVCVETLGLNGKEDFKQYYRLQPKTTQEKHQYVLRFAENLLLRFFESHKNNQ